VPATPVAPGAGLPAALQLRHPVVNVVGGDTGTPVEAVGSDRAILQDPVVVARKQAPAGRRLESESSWRSSGRAPRRYPIRRHLLHPARGGPTTRVSLKEPAHLPLGENTGAWSLKATGQAVLPISAGSRRCASLPEISGSSPRDAMVSPLSPCACHDAKPRHATPARTSGRQSALHITS